MRFQVPQFIDVEDKIFGPFTFRQFLYLFGGAGLIFVFLNLFPRIIAVLLAIPVALFSVGLAFYRVNNRPFIQLVEAYFKYFFGSRLYLWKKKDEPNPTVQSVAGAKYASVEVPKMSNSKLRDLFWTLDVKEDPKAEKEEEV